MAIKIFFTSIFKRNDMKLKKLTNSEATGIHYNCKRGLVTNLLRKGKKTFLYILNIPESLKFILENIRFLIRNAVGPFIRRKPGEGPPVHRRPEAGFIS